MKKIAAIIVALLLAGCAGVVPWNPQGYSGITKADVEVGVAKAGEVPYIKSVTFWNGKEFGSVALTVEFLDGKPKVTYTAAGVTAFDGQRVRAAVEKAVSDDVRATAPAIVDTIMDAVKGSMGIPSLR